MRVVAPHQRGPGFSAAVFPWYLEKRREQAAPRPLPTSASTSTNNRSRPSRARSTFTCTTSRASRCCAGPQGTLYGASSQAGTIRIITNKPDPSGFEGGSARAQLVSRADAGDGFEGFVNVPLSDGAALRLVGWSRPDAGFIDNVEAGTRLLRRATSRNPRSTTPPSPTMREFAEDNYNTRGHDRRARGAAHQSRRELDASRPALMYQKMDQEGSWGDATSATPLVVRRQRASRTSADEFADDEWWQAGADGRGDDRQPGRRLLRQLPRSRQFQSIFDYSDYSYWYDVD